MTGALTGRVGAIGGQKTPRFFGGPIALRVTHDVVRLLASEVRPGGLSKLGMKNGHE